MQRLYRSSAHRRRIKATIKSADAGAIQIKGPQSDAKDDNEEGGCRGYTDQGHAER